MRNSILLRETIHIRVARKLEKKWVWDCVKTKKMIFYVVPPQISKNSAKSKKNPENPAQSEKIWPTKSMITFQNQKSFRMDDLKGIDKTISTLLIPAHLITPLKEKIKEHGNLFPVYLRNLLWMFRTFTHSGMIKKKKK